MKRRSLLIVAVCPFYARAREPYVDYLPNLPTELPDSLESEQQFLAQCREEESFFFIKHTGKLYSSALYAAAQGDPNSLADIFRIASFQDGAGAESFAGTLFWLLHRVGDEKFSRVLAARSPKVRKRVIDFLDYAASYDYSSKYPKTFKQARHEPL